MAAPDALARDHGQKVVEVMGDTASELSDGLHLLRLQEILLHLDARRQVPDEAGEDMGPAKRHLADREVHRKDRAVLAPRFDLAVDADAVLRRSAGIGPSSRHGPRDAAEA